MGGVALGASDATWGPEILEERPCERRKPKGRDRSWNASGGELHESQTDLWREPYSIEWYKTSEFAQRKGRGGMSLQTTWGNP